MDPTGIPIQSIDSPPVDDYDDDDSDRLVSSSAATSSAAGGGAGARYKLMSPAKLPISRSPCMTIPPGLSPTSFLESPVLLSNVKVEPSPTTGSLKKLLMNGFLGSSTETGAIYDGCAEGLNEGNCGDFEFKHPARSNLVPGWFKSQASEPSEDFFSAANSQSISSVNPVMSNLAVPSEELSLSIPAGPVISEAIATEDTDIDGLNCREFPNNGAGAGPSVLAERLSADGYNWRKYGQKHVKGCEFPRNYYKCAYPNCEVKKLFERSPEGQLTEIIYKGTHDHPKPQASRRITAGDMAPLQPQEDGSDKFSFPTSDRSPPAFGDSNGILELSPIAENETVEEAASASNRILQEVDDDDDDPLSKRRRLDTIGEDATAIVKPIREPRVVVQTISEVDILDDGYRWRKYGQKVVRGNPNPRSYYKCTNAGCPVRKHVERASHDHKAVITTYEGKHNHNVPTAKPSSQDTGVPPDAPPSRVRSMSEGLSLDLGVGRHPASVILPSNNQLLLPQDYVRNQLMSGASNLSVIQGAQISSFPGLINGALSQ
ncbi:hypothetical protein MLD38_034269 [Melastoma candidum]|uniref:Uncharacterized protein n=1 Tax=Melastoma candidum TaxID=119954 RepID=A0ACB9MBR1_9MYRT|nr:hypothetical protein MLD38_034269 [Melastoma candidum]